MILGATLTFRHVETNSWKVGMLPVEKPLRISRTAEIIDLAKSVPISTTL